MPSVMVVPEDVYEMDSGMTLDILIRIADKAMYAMKKKQVMNKRPAPPANSSY